MAALGDQQNELPDRYIILLEEVVKSNKALIAENRAMRTELEAKNEQHGRALKDLNANLANLNGTQNTGPRNNNCGRARQARNSRVKVSSACRVSIQFEYLIFIFLYKYWPCRLSKLHEEFISKTFELMLPASSTVIRKGGKPAEDRLTFNWLCIN
jgi:hypothetical protein